ncbi:MAG TPA: LytR C-terminal domain-containing protein [Nocardioidaceae bacterium]|nr:LytR C-terminal domain-containing protein [Nocardioidaceae bacterium]
MRRQVTSTITMLVLIGLLAVGATWGWKQLFADAPGLGAEPAPICSTQQVKGGEKITTRQVTVSVYNGGTKSGMAGKTLDMLAKRGFGKGDIGNAPPDVQVRMVQVWSTVENDGEAQLVARQFGKDVKVAVSEQDLGPGVDVIIGNAFKRLVKAPRTFELQHPEKVCVPAEPSPPPA